MDKKVLIPGRPEFTKNYEAAVASYGASPIVSFSDVSAKDYELLLLPGGGDIHPSFFNQTNTASRNLDYELDQAQFKLLDRFVKAEKPVLGICKGMQLINVYFGGNILQNMNADQLAIHSYQEEDSYHLIFLNTLSSIPLKIGFPFFPGKMLVNSAHHQCIDHLGQGLTTLQYSLDYVPETIAHINLPVLGFQWHPERLDYNGKNSLHPFLHHFLKLS
ncbi:MAG: C26 family cysteine hydrolase domain-containing family [Lachnospiraceae bacterium]|nr:C26 family cysteine hydrolase domain-containing family [Lachnospiraceae bacterium]